MPWITASPTARVALDNEQDMVELMDCSVAAKSATRFDA